jgi:hypothetical protein
MWFILIFYSSLVLATIGPDNIVKIEQTSTTGKTLILNMGSSGNLVEGELGVLLTSIKLEDRIQFKPVAKIKAVKVFKESSIWVAFDVFIPSQLEKGVKLVLLSENRLLSGRENLTFKRSKIISEKKNLKKDLKENLLEGTDNISVKEKKYGVLQQLHPKEKHFDRDIELVDLDIWSDKKIGDKKEATSFYKSKYAKDFQTEHRIQTFEKMVVAFVRKYNDPKFTIARRYFEDRDANSINPDVNSRDTYDAYIESEDVRLGKEEKVYDDLASKGEAWSDGYSDEQLSELVYNVGIVKERERRKVVSAYQFSHQAYTHFGLNLINNENLKDRVNTAQSKYDIELGYEYFAFKSIESLQKISFELSGRRAVDAYSIGSGFNATSTEYSFAGGLNYYPFRPANTLETNIVYLGLYIRTGLSILQVSESSETGSYSVLSIPGVRGGLKYNFPNGYGIRVFGSFENIQTSRIQRSDDEGVLPDVASLTEGKMSIGLSKFF